MKKIFAYFLAITFFTQSLSSVENHAEITVGYRHDCLNWTIAGPHGHPNVLSELEWKDISSVQASFIGALTVLDCYYLRGKADYGKIVDGRVIDSDYYKDHRQDLFSLSHSSAGQGDLYDLSIGFGKQFMLLHNYIWAAPLIGYSYHKQNLTMYNGDQKVYAPRPSFVGRIDGLHSSYKASWRGPWVGADAKVCLIDCLNIVGTFEYHLAKYFGKGHWNLRTDFLDDFTQKAYGHGFLYKLGFEYYLRTNICLLLSGTYQNWRTGKGQDKTFVEVDEFVNGTLNSNPYLIKTRFNRARWQSFDIMLGAALKF